MSPTLSKSMNEQQPLNKEEDSENNERMAQNPMQTIETGSESARRLGGG